MENQNQPIPEVKIKQLSTIYGTPIVVLSINGIEIDIELNDELEETSAVINITEIMNRLVKIYRLGEWPKNQGLVEYVTDES